MKFLILSLSLISFALVSCDKPASSHAGEHLINIAGASSVALDGHDPVAFFTEKKPLHGNPEHTAEHKGATYFFASKKNQKTFKEAPEKYAPQFGGFCAYGASFNALFPVDIQTWQVRDDKLYLNLNSEIVDAFNADFDGNVAKGTKNWPALVEKHTN